MGKRQQQPLLAPLAEAPLVPVTKGGGPEVCSNSLTFLHPARCSMSSAASSAGGCWHPMAGETSHGPASKVAAELSQPSSAVNAL